MKRALSFERRELALVVAGTSLIAGTYGLVRLACGLYLSDIQASLDLSSATLGYVSSAASMAYCAGALVGLRADRRPRALVLAALATGSLGAAGMALAPGAALFVPMAVIGSAGAGLASPGLVGVVVRCVAQTRQDRAQAVVNSGTGPGLVGAGALALALLPHWRLGFAVGAVFTALVGVAVLVVGRSPAWSAGSEPRAAGTASWRSLAALRVPALGALLLGTASAAVWTYGRAQLVGEGIATAWSTIGWMSVGVGGTATVLTAGLLSRLGPRRHWLLTCAGVAVSIAVLALGAGQLPAALVACCAFGWAFVAATSALIAWAAELAPGRAAAGTSVLFVTLTLGQAVGSVVAGTVADHGGLAAAFLVAAVVAAAGAACGRAGARPADAEAKRARHLAGRSL